MHVLRQTDLDGPPCPDTLIHGECLEAMQFIEPGSVDLILTDLPYGTTDCKWDTVIPFEPLWAAYRRVLKPTGAVVLFGSQPFTSALVMSNPKWFKYEWVWNKTRASGQLHAKNKPMKIHENILVFSPGTTVHQCQSKTRMTYNPQGLVARKTICRGDRKKREGKCYVFHTSHKSVYVSEQTNYPASRLDFANSPNGSLHPTQKPVPLFEYLVRTYSHPGEIVLDSTSGSGTTAIAAIQSGRRYLCIEQDAAYFEIGVARVRAAELDALSRLAL